MKQKDAFSDLAEILPKADSKPGSSNGSSVRTSEGEKIDLSAPSPAKQSIFPSKK